MTEKTIDEILQKLIDNAETDNWVPVDNSPGAPTTLKLSLSKNGVLCSSIIRIHWGIISTWNLHFNIDDINIITVDVKDDKNPTKLFELYKKITDKIGIKHEDHKNKALSSLINNLF